MNEKFFMLTDLLWNSVNFAYQQNCIAFNLFITIEEQVSRIFRLNSQTSSQHIQLLLWVETIKNLKLEISEQRSCTLGVRLSRTFGERFREKVIIPLTQILEGLKEIIATQTIVGEEI